MQLNLQCPNRRRRVSRHKMRDCDVGHVTSYEWRDNAFFLSFKKRKSISQFHIRCNVLEYKELRVKVQFHPISRNITQAEMPSRSATCAFWGSD